MANGTAWFPILKSEKQDDGTLKVWGKATGPDLDLDAQICDPAWLKAAMPAWMEWGNVREQHSSIAAGVGLTLEQQGDDWLLESLVVDPGSVKKVEAGVLKGYSIGIRNPKVVKDAAAPGGRIAGGTIVEVSLVDRPANPTCTLTLAKAVGTGELQLVDVPSQTGEVGRLIVESIKGFQSTKAPDMFDTAGDMEDESGAPLSATQEVDEAGEAGEVDLIAQVRAALASLLASEAAEVGTNTGTTYVVRLLLDIISDLDWFVTADAWDDEEAAINAAMAGVKAAFTNPQEVAGMAKATLADLVKSATADDATDDDKTAVAELRKVLGVDEAVETATKSATDAEAKATAAEEALKGLAVEFAKVRDELDAVKEMAAPGGPTRIPPAEQAAKAAQHAQRQMQASKYRTLAKQVTDRELAAAYDRMAADLEQTL